MSKLLSILPLLGVGMLVGILSGLLGIGGGVVMVPALLYLWGQEMQVAVGTSLAVMIPGAIVGALRHHYSYGNVDWRVATFMALGAMAGTYFIGAPLAEALHPETLKKIFGLIIVVLGLRITGVFEWLVALFAR